MYRRYRTTSPARSCLRAFLATSFVLLTGTFFAISGGPPTRAEVSEINGAYAGFLSNVESAAHTLRMDACAQGADCHNSAISPAVYADAAQVKSEPRPA
ncbi:MAG TPA: hypothetical protein VG943_14920 [Caulobacterales bacterium]|nr:hypothetical protein [Caulobacterales bacterium]